LRIGKTHTHTHTHSHSLSLSFSIYPCFACRRAFVRFFNPEYCLEDLQIKGEFRRIHRMIWSITICPQSYSREDLWKRVCRSSSVAGTFEVADLTALGILLTVLKSLLIPLPPEMLKKKNIHTLKDFYNEKKWTKLLLLHSNYSKQDIIFNWTILFLNTNILFAGFDELSNSLSFSSPMYYYALIWYIYLTYI